VVKREYREQIIEIIKKHLPEAKIYLFGSRSRGTNHPGSDIDIAVDTSHKIDRSIIHKIKDELEDTTIPFFVDVIDWYSAEDTLKSQVKKDGILWTSWS
jgi:uncharacterized protein